jgi:SPP1 gp7 family putative phage head morphogenesis protein
VGLHLSNLLAAARGHKPRHPRARRPRRLRPIVPAAKNELAYKATLLSLVKRCRRLVDGALDDIRAHWYPAPGLDGVAADGIASGVVTPISRAQAALGGLDKWARRMAGLAAEANRDTVDERLAREIHRAIGVDVSAMLKANGPLLQSMQKATEANVALIKSIPEQYFGRVYSTVTEGWVSGLRWESLVEQIQRDGDITENRAKLIARDQTSKMNASFNQERQQQVGIERYEWSTSQDERVRDSHADMDGKIVDWASPPMVDGEAVHAGEAINCRCTAIPVVDMQEVGAAAGVAEQIAEAA